MYPTAAGGELRSGRRTAEHHVPATVSTGLRYEGVDFLLMLLLMLLVMVLVVLVMLMMKDAATRSEASRFERRTAAGLMVPADP